LVPAQHQQHLPCIHTRRSSDLAMSVGRDIRARFYAQVNKLGSLDVSRFGAATLSTRGTNDVQQVQMLTLLTLNLMVTAPIMSVRSEEHTSELQSRLELVCRLLL